MLVWHHNISIAMAAEQRKVHGMAYQDVSPLDSGDESGSDTDPIVRAARDSTEVADHDRELLNEDEEREKLLASNGRLGLSDGFFGRSRNVGKSQGKAGRHRAKRRHKVGRGNMKDEEGKLMYEMEEGGTLSDVSSQASRSSVDLDKMDSARRSVSRVRRNDVTTLLEAK